MGPWRLRERRAKPSEVRLEGRWRGLDNPGTCALFLLLVLARGVNSLGLSRRILRILCTAWAQARTKALHQARKTPRFPCARGFVTPGHCLRMR